jgi:hypothetical protein
MQVNPELSMARCCNDLIDARPSLQDMRMLAYTLEKIAENFTADERSSLSALLLTVAFSLDKDARAYAAVRH